MITDLRNDLYEAVLRRSVAFFQKHATGTLLSTLINDIEKVQFAMSSVLGDFLQQIFTLLFLIGVVVLYGGKLAWILLLFVPVIDARRRGALGGGCGRRRGAGRTSWRRSRTFCTRRLRATGL